MVRATFSARCVLRADQPSRAAVVLRNLAAVSSRCRCSSMALHRLAYADLVILDELGYLPFSASGGALLFHLLSKLYERTSVVITANLSFSEWPTRSEMPR
jgi:DNA replication protein DnaC